MPEWTEHKLKDFAEVQTGPFGSQLHASDYVETGIPTIMPTNIGDRLNIVTDELGYVSEENVERLKRHKVRDGDIVYSRRGDVEKCAYITAKQNGWLCGTGSLRIRFVSDQVIPKFCAYYLSTADAKYWILNSAVGTTMPNLNSKILAEFPLVVPSVEEQRAIASILSSLDDKIDLLHRQNKTLEALAKTLFRQWFVEEAEDGWEVGKLGDVIMIYDSLRKPVSSMEREKMKVGQLYPYYGAATIMDYVNDYIFDGEYILMGEDGTVQTEDGYPILQLPTGKFWVNNHAHILQAKEPYSNFFMYIFLKRTNIAHIVTGAVQPKINQENLKSVEFPIPPEEKVETFVSITNDFWDKMKSNNSQIAMLTQLRDTLLPKLMSGEVRVSNTDMHE